MTTTLHSFQTTAELTERDGNDLLFLDTRSTGVKLLSGDPVNVTTRDGGLLAGHVLASGLCTVAVALD